MPETGCNEHRVLNLGAGVQSTTVYLMYVRGEITPQIEYAIFADTGEEPASIYRHLEWLKSLNGPPIVSVSIGKLGDDLQQGRNSTGQRFASIPAFTAAREGHKAGIVRRQCTREYKIDPIERYIRGELLGMARGQRVPAGTMVHQSYGISLDEAGRSARIRERLAERHWLTPVFPLLDRQMTRGDCYTWLQAFGVPHEVNKSACVFCPFKSNAEWRRLRDTDPEGWSRAVQIDTALRAPGNVVNRNMDQKLYVHASCVPLEKAVLGFDEDPRQYHLGLNWTACVVYERADRETSRSMTVTPIAPQMARRIEVWPIERLVPYARNARTHSPEQIAQIAASIVEFGFNAPILVASDAGIVAGHGRLLAARKLGLADVPVVVLDHLSETQRRAYIIADNKLALNAGWDEKVLAEELRELEGEGLDLAVVGFSDEELESLLVEPEAPDDAEEDVPEPPANPVTRPGDVWMIGKHRLVCGDCRDRNVLATLFPSGTRANVCITSPPYATQREYDTASGFKPVPPEEYVEWFREVAGGVESVLAPDGSYFLNIKAHADEGERNLYVMDLVLAHRRQWGWRFVDEFCWRKTDNGVPGGWGNRFKNAFEPIYHFCRQQRIKFRPQAVGHESDDCFEYSPNNPKSRSGSGLLGTGVRGAAADGGKNQGTWGRTRSSLSSDSEGRHTGLARPSNVIEVKSESSQGSHSAPFPRALVEFFLLAFSDAGDVIHDPFLGSGTTMAASETLDRVGYGCEISPAYCDVIVRRLINLAGAAAVLESTGQPFAEVAESRGVDPNAALNSKTQDSRAIKHTGPNPHYGPQRKAS